MRWPTALLLLTLACRRTTTYSGVGDVVAVDDPPRHVTISHDDIPDLMPAMTMAFPVRSPEVLAGVAPGTRVRFQLVREGENLTVTQVVPVGLASGARPGLHDHTPHHGGVVAMAGLQHLEAVASPDGRVRVYLSDVWRRPEPVAGVTGSVTLDLPDGKRTLPLGVSEEALEARGPPLGGPEVRAHVQIARDGAPVELHFLLPLRADRSGAALVPAEGCVPVVPAEGPRQPRCVLTFPQPVTVVTTTPDGATALLAAVNAWVTVWRMPAGELVTGLAPPPPVAAPTDAPPHAEAVTAVAVGPDGRQAVVAIEKRLLRYAVGSGRLLRELPGPGGMVRSVAWSADGTRLLVTAFYDPNAHLLAAEDGRELGRIPVPQEGAAVAFSPDGRWAAVGSEVGPIAVVDASSAGPPRLLVGCTRATEALAFAGGRLLSAAADGLLRMWDPGSGAPVAAVNVGSGLLRFAVAPGGRLVASTGVDHVIHLHDLTAGTEVEALAWHGGAVVGLAWAGSVLVSGDTEGRVAFWDLDDRVGATP